MSNEAFIVLATGRDRAGIVERISGAIYDSGCNLEDSRMSILGGEFALIVLVAGPSENVTKAREDLESIADELGLTMQLKPTALPDGDAVRALPYRLQAIAMDHPGIVHKVTRLLSRRGVNVARLDTRLSHAPVTGTPIFSLELEAQIPVDLSVPRLRTELQQLAEEENIDIELRAAE